MSTLLDIASVSEMITVPAPKDKTQEVEVFGVSAEGIAMLFKRFPEIRMMMTGQALEKDRLAELAPAAIASIIAAATGHPGNKKAELIASRLPLESQLDILEAAVKLTMPNGIGPFVKRFQSLAEMLGTSDESTITEAATKSPLLSSI